jgi:hypothetical protein
LAEKGESVTRGIQLDKIVQDGGVLSIDPKQGGYFWTRKSTHLWEVLLCKGRIQGQPSSPRNSENENFFLLVSPYVFIKIFQKSMVLYDDFSPKILHFKKLKFYVQPKMVKTFKNDQKTPKNG